MSLNLVLSFRFLGPWFHGRGDEGKPEWPPSPLRAFQALVASAGRAGTLESIRGALTSLEERPPPLVVAPEASASTVGYRLSVPHNAMDLVAKQWVRGDDGNASEHRTMKNVRPHRLPHAAVVHYVWRFDGDTSPAASLIAAARGVVSLGWGVDLVVGDGVVVDDSGVDRLSEGLTVWVARLDGRHELRVPQKGTLDDLERRHGAFLCRTSFADPTLRPPPPLSAFSIMTYGRIGQQRCHEVAAFTLMRVDSDKFRAFATARRGMAVAGMLRHAVRMAAERAGWQAERVASSLLGHGRAPAARLLLVPVPSIEPRGVGAESVGAVRRVMVFSTDQSSRDTAWARRALGGVDLVDEQSGEVQAVLASGSPYDRVFDRYCTESRVWATVTPVLLPGHDDPGGLKKKVQLARSGDEQRCLLRRLMKRREALVRKALRQAGLGDEMALAPEIEMSDVGFIAGVEHARRYAVPRHLVAAPRFHVKLTWPSNVTGPLCIGRGRFSGLGLFAAIDG